MATEGLTYTQYLYSISNPQARQMFINLENAVSQGQITPAQFAVQVEELTGKTVSIHRSASGDILGYTLNNVSSVGASNPINSNAGTVARGAVSMPVSTGVNQAGKATATRLAGIGSKALTGAAMVGTAAAVVATGITLGKTIDSALYNLNPDFWDSHNMSTLNPETWRAITNGDDSLGASLINMLFGFDDDGNGQAYIDENALAYFAAYMKSKGVFNPTDSAVNPDSIPSSFSVNNPVFLYDSICNIQTLDFYESSILSNEDGGSYGAVDVFFSKPSESNAFKYTLYSTPSQSSGASILVASAVDSLPNYLRVAKQNSHTYHLSSTYLNTLHYTYDNKTVYYAHGSVHGFVTNFILSHSISEQQTQLGQMAWAMVYGEATAAGGIEGIGNQQDATLPNVNDWADIPSTLSSLQSQYPDLWNNAINYPVIQDDGSVKNYNYVPIPFPDILNRSDTQPVSGSSSQTNTEILPSILPKELVDTLTNILTSPYPKTSEDVDNPKPPENPTDTGDGSSPVPTVPVGSASALWKIYHPTQAQIDSFGGWLWSSNFIDQILKIFNNPMEAVIGLHKVYATPIDAGNATIKVGYLDSQVPSAYIEQQYIDVDCGSVDLYEQFGNVFDYSPFTDVQLYLPFVGIVPLNVGDVMRSTISITYGVDVITGACLAQVEINRDGNNSVLYQYSGNCAVQYPISSGSYMGIVSSIISVAGGVAATVASGGAAAPLALGAAGGLLSAHTNVQHSGGFSGNAGAMGGKIPYLIISRPQTKVADNAGALQGYPTNAYTTIGECSGYVKADSVHVINVNATDEEMTEINNLILSGIII